MTQSLHQSVNSVDAPWEAPEDEGPTKGGGQAGGVLGRAGRWLVATGRGRILLTVVNIAVFGVLWETVVQVTDVRPVFLPALSSIWHELHVMIGEGIYFPTVRSSVWYYAWTMLLSIVIAIPLGMGVGSFSALDRTLGPYLWAAFMTPRIVFIPVILLWLGINEWGKLGIILTSTVPPMAVVVLDGAKTVDASLVKVARSFGAGRLQTLRKVVMPASMPFVGTGLRLGFARGLVGLFAAELFTASEGLGYVMYQASRQFNGSRVFVMLLTFLVLSLLTVGATSALEKRLSRWRGEGATL